MAKTELSRSEKKLVKNLTPVQLEIVAEWLDEKVSDGRTWYKIAFFLQSMAKRVRELKDEAV